MIIDPSDEARSIGAAYSSAKEDSSMRNKPRKVEDQGYVMAWDSEVPLHGDEPIAHDFVAIMGLTLVPRAKFEALGKFKAHRPGIVEFEGGSLSVNFFKAVGTEAWLKMQLSKSIRDTVDVVYFDRAMTGAGKTRRPQRRTKSKT